MFHKRLSACVERTGTIIIAQSPAGHNWAHGVKSSVKLLQTGEEYCKVLRVNAWFRILSL